MTKTFNLWIFGPSCSGKGTLVDKLQKKLDIPAIATGDALRSVYSAGGPLAERLTDTMKHGALAPTDLVIDVMIQALNSDPEKYKNGVIFDGAGRIMKEAKAYIDRGIIPDAMIVLDAPKDLIIKRALGRLIHKKSGRTYHEEFAPPITPGLDDITSEPLERRGDDTEDGILKRLSWYETETIPTINWIKSLNIPTLTLDGSQDKDKTLQDAIQFSKNIMNQKKNSK